MIFDARTVSMLVKETWRTLYMVGLSSLISYLIGIPLGVALVVTDKDGIRPVPLFNKVAGVIVNLLRSVPFIILLAMVMPLTRAIVGKTIGANAAVVPLVIAVGFSPILCLLGAGIGLLQRLLRRQDLLRGSTAERLHLLCGIRIYLAHFHILFRCFHLREQFLILDEQVLHRLD